MRVISGKYRGRVLFDFKGKDIRPTSDRAKEAIFSILQNQIAGRTFLDLFAGTGAMGIEALSRGAEQAVFCDKEKFAVELIKSNLEKLQLKQEVILYPALFALNKFISLGRKFDIIFLDPPYGTHLGKDAVEIIDKNNLLNEDGVLIYEYSEREKIKVTLENLEEVSQRKYGKSMFNIYKQKETST